MVGKAKRVVEGEESVESKESVIALALVVVHEPVAVAFSWIMLPTKAIFGTA
jgi:hypothetical protein